MAYAIRILPAALEQLEQLPKKFRGQIVKKIDRLAEDPFPPTCTQLEGKENSGVYRIRSGDHRILYTVSATEVLVTVVRIADRKDAYRGL